MTRGEDLFNIVDSEIDYGRDVDLNNYSEADQKYVIYSYLHLGRKFRAIKTHYLFKGRIGLSESKYYIDHLTSQNIDYFAWLKAYKILHENENKV